MAAVQSPQNIVLNIEPLFTKEAGFVSFNSREFANGYMPTIEVTMKAFEDITELTEEQNISLITSYGSTFKCKAYVYDISFIGGNCVIKMMPVPAEFMRKVKTSTYKGGEAVITSVYPGDIDKDVKSDLISSLPLYQKSETDYSFLTKILSAYKHNAIFAYTLGGLIIRDLSAYKSVMELNRLGESESDQSQELSDPKRYSSDVEILERFTNHIKVRVYDQIFDVNSEYESLIGNRIFFERFNSAKSSFTFRTKELLSANLCEGIKYYSQETKVDNTYIHARIINFTAMEVLIDYTLKSINP